ncbi:hypothetical protein BB559_005996 [Furculomyces boomerangus]|uniref:tRNA (guanine(9)-N1)-methyltransferase n=1 Tax=Furculomyces boomerangus TaxID=61424 RepID=A0A2T9Y5F5_9FUNG|nr:hypothetical protein BB559_005996 [Furculomyces boomerangus]
MSESGTNSETKEQVLKHFSRVNNVDEETLEKYSLEKLGKKLGEISKNARKKLIKDINWDKNKDARVEARKQKKKEASNLEPKKRKTELLEQQKNSGINIVLDMSYDELMVEHEITSIGSQVMRCYSANKNSLCPVNLYITKLEGKTKKRFDERISEHLNWKQEHIKFLDESSYYDYFVGKKFPSFETNNETDKNLEDESVCNPKDIVYLTADSDNVVNELDPKKVYIIGGIVDKNRYPKLTEKKAIEQGISTARLPIDQYLKMSTRKVLTVNHVFEILLEFISTKDWEKSFLKVIPQRKFKSDDDTKN